MVSDGQNQCVSELKEMWECRYFTNTLKSRNTLNSRMILQAGPNAVVGQVWHAGRRLPIPELTLKALVKHFGNNILMETI